MAKGSLNGGNGKPYSVDVGVPQKRFYLGTVRDEAERRKTKLLEFWSCWATEARQPKWNDLSLLVAHAIRKGESDVTIDFPSPGGDTAVDAVEYRAAIDHLNEQFGRFGLRFLPGDSAAYGKWDEVQDRWERLVDLWQTHHRAGGGGGHLVGQTLDAFGKSVVADKIDPATRRPTEWAVKVSDMCCFIRRQVPQELTLRDFNYAALNRLCVSLANRPPVKRGGTPCSPKYAGACLKTVRQWVRWLSKHYEWRRPEDWEEATRHQPKVSGDERAKRRAAVALSTYTDDELATLNRYASPAEQAMLLLGLNCGFGGKEVATLRPDEVFRQDDGVYIKRCRLKSGIYGEWKLWPETIAALDAVTVAKTPYVLCRRGGGCLIQQTPAGRSNKVAAAWGRLLKRVRKDQPEFRSLSFNKLRKTSSRAIRRLAGGEAASIFLAHGETTDDDQLEAYASRHFAPLFEALDQYRQEIKRIFDTPLATGRRAVVPLGRIEHIRALWHDGVRPEEIAKATGASRATVYRYRPPFRGGTGDGAATTS
jgi:hypothetical protein